MCRTLVAFHAHPDDEALLTVGHDGPRRGGGPPGGAGARHRRRGGSGLGGLPRDGRLGARRLAEARRSSAGAGRGPGGVARLRRQRQRARARAGPAGAPGSAGPTSRRRRTGSPRCCATERADVLLTYDRNGGYGHRDHVRVHQVARGPPSSPAPRGCSRPPCPATPSAGRSRSSAASTASRRSSTRPRSSAPSPPALEITHRVNVRRYTGAKRASMRAHASHAAARTADGGADRTLAAFLRIPRPSTISCSVEGVVPRPRPPAGADRVRTDIVEGPRRVGQLGRRPGKSLRRPCIGLVGLGLAAACSSGACRTSPRRRGPTFGGHPHQSARPRRRPSGPDARGLWHYTFTFTGSLPGLSHGRALIVNLCGSSVGNLLPGGGAVGLAATYAHLPVVGLLAAGHLDVGRSSPASGTSWPASRCRWSPSARCGSAASPCPPAAHRPRRGRHVHRRWRILARVRRDHGERAGRAGDRARPRRVLGPLTRRRRAKKAAADASARGGRGASAAPPMSIEELVTDLRARINDVVSSGWSAMTLGMVGFFGAYYVLFVLIMRETGVTLPLNLLFAAFAIGRLLTAVGITPGGMGITETATVGGARGVGRRRPPARRPASCSSRSSRTSWRCRSAPSAGCCGRRAPRSSRTTRATSRPSCQTAT